MKSAEKRKAAMKQAMKRTPSSSSSPKPVSKTAHNSAWTRQHQDLYDALLAERTLPHFCRRLSLEFTTINHARARAWKDWSRLLRNDPGWTQIEAVLELPDAWPKIWHQVSPHGWSALTDNHNARFFADLFPAALDARNYETALYAFEQAIHAWNRSFQSSPAQIYADAHPINALLRHSLFDALKTLPLEDPQRARLAWQALHFAATTPLSKRLQPFSHHAQARATETLDNARTNFTDHIRALDLTTAPPEFILKPFQQAAEFFAILQDATPALTASFQQTVLETAINLSAILHSEHHTTYPDSDLLPTLFQTLKPLNDALFAHLLARNSEAFDATPEHQKNLETCASFLLIEGDLQSSASRRLPFYEQALRICPEHAAARTRAAQACLERANILLLATAAIPGFAANIPGVQRLRTRVKQARDLYFRALSLDPDHELLETYRTEISLECERFDIPFTPADASRPPSTSADQTDIHTSPEDHS